MKKKTVTSVIAAAIAMSSAAFPSAETASKAKDVGIIDLLDDPGPVVTADQLDIIQEHADEKFRIITTAAKGLDVNPVDVDMLACAIYQEAGGNAASDKCRMMVGDVILNRVADERFPNNIHDVLTQKRQYGRFWLTGIVWPERASNANEAYAVQRAYDIAERLLSGEHTELYGKGYIWQAEFKQGHDIIYLDGLYFGK